MSSRTKRLRELLSGVDPVVAVEAYSVLTARVVERTGFDVTYCGGGGFGAMHYGVPDYGLISISEIVEQAGRIAASTSVPLISDADQAGETSLNVRRTVQAFEDAGVAGIHIEDTINPKHSDSKSSLQPVSEMCARIDAAVGARTDPDFLIIARSDEVFNGGTLDHAIERGIAYADAGADAYMCILASPARPDPPVEEYAKLVAEVPIPVVDVNVPIDRAKSIGLGIDIFTGPSVFAAASRHRELVSEIRDHGNWSNLHRTATEEHEYQALVRTEQWIPVATDWRKATAQP